MTTREEYAEAASASEALRDRMLMEGMPSIAKRHELAARVLRARADGAVLCKPTWDRYEGDEGAYVYFPLDPQP